MEAGCIATRTVALDALIKATVARFVQKNFIGLDTMLFAGSWHQAVPSLVIQDPVLEPVVAKMWMSSCYTPGDRRSNDDYDTIAAEPTSSASTVSPGYQLFCTLTR